ncbi:MAG: thioredoxin family protein [Kosmotogaceae bacterium]|nr:thioredoxin family protein [Kosmotogaceae bacterium]
MKEITLRELREVNGLVVMDFFSPGCGVCIAIEPKLEAVEKDFPSWKFYKINTVENPTAASEYWVFTVPTIIVQMDGREQKRWSRYFSLEEVIEYLREIDETER